MPTTRAYSQQPSVASKTASTTYTHANKSEAGTELTSNEPEPTQQRIAHRLGEVHHEHTTLQALVPHLNR